MFKELSPTDVTMRELNYFTRGKAMHEALQGLFLSNPRRFKKEYPVDFEDTEATIDLYDNRLKVAIEFKTHDTEDIEQPHKFHLDQLKYYMAILDLDKGAVIYQLLRHKGEKPLKQFPVYMKKWERLAQLAKLSSEMESLKNAVDKKDPSLARAIYDDKELNWLCWTCPFKTECEGMRPT